MISVNVAGLLKEHDAYSNGLERLLRDLKVEASPSDG